MQLNEAVSYLNKPGTLGVIATDTVYGLVARASDMAAVKRLYTLKERDQKPGTVIAADIEQLVELGLKRRYLVAVRDYWPSPLSVIIPTGAELDYLHLGKNGLAVRIPADKQLTNLLSSVGPLLSSSANLTNHKPSTTIEQAKDYFDGKVDFYIDGGDLSAALPSTIIRIVDDAVEVIREGAYKLS